MGVYIKGMEMPNNCFDCDFAKSQWYDKTFRCCVPSEESFSEKVDDFTSCRPSFCPLVEITLEESNMRDEKRIDNFIIYLADIWHDYPDLRFVQLIQNVFRDPGDYYLEDSDALKKLEDFYYVKIKGER